MANFNVTCVEENYDTVRREWRLHLKSDEGAASSSFLLTSPYDTNDEAELTWYLEQYADDPFATARASQISSCLQDYGQALALILEPALINLMTKSGSDRVYNKIQIGVLGTGPQSRLQSIHWEILEQMSLWRPTIQDYASQVSIVRFVTQDGTGVALRPEITTRSINVLIVSARPVDIENDVPYRLVSRKIWSIVRSSEDLTSWINIYFARPGRFSELEKILELKKKHFFSIVHFDGHGIVRRKDQTAVLYFASEDAHSQKSKAKSASAIADLLYKWGVENVVLNACNSANALQPPTSNLAQTFIQHGISRVVAMSYAVKTDTAAMFVESLYHDLFRSHASFEEAVSKSRGILKAQTSRKAAYGVDIDVEDFIVPVLYQCPATPPSWNNASPLEFAAGALSHSRSSRATHIHTEELEDPPVEESTCRDMDLLSLELLLATSRPVLVTGAGGCGKTTFARHLQDWWERTDYAEGVVYLSFVSDQLRFDNNSIYEKAVLAVRRAKRDLEVSQSSQTIGNSFHEFQESADTLRNYIHRSRLVLLLDDLPVSEDGGSPFNSCLERERLLNFLSRFGKEDNQCKLVLFSRITPDIQSLNAIENEVGHHAMVAPSIEEADQIGTYYLKRAEAKSGKSYYISAAAAKDLHDFVHFHEKNVFFLKVFIPVLVRTSQSPGDLLKHIQYGLPRYCIEALDPYLGWQSKIESSLSENQPSLAPSVIPDILASFNQGLYDYGMDNPLAYWILLSFAPFQRRIPQDLRPWLFRLISNGILQDEFTDLFYEIHSQSVKFFDHQAWIDFADQNPQFDLTLRSVTDFLLSTGLMFQERAPERPSSYWTINPLLPYVLRYTILTREENDGETIMEGLTKAFWEFMDARAMIILEDADETQVQLKLASMLEQDGYNVGNAVEISLNDGRFAERRIFLYTALVCLALPRLTISQLQYWEKVLDSILKRYEFLEYEVPEEELLGYQGEPVVKAILDDVILLACTRGSILHGYLHKNEDVAANTERSLRLVQSIAGGQGILPSVEAGVLMLRLQKCITDNRSWPERRAEVRELLETPVPDGLPPDRGIMVRSARGGLIMKTMTDIRNGNVAESAFDMTALSTELEETFSDVPRSAVASNILASSYRLGSFGKSISNFLSGPVDDGAFSTMVNEAHRTLGGMPSFNAMTSWARNFSAERREFTSSSESRRQEFHLKLVQARSQNNLHQEYYYLKQLFNIAIDDSDFQSALDRHDELLESEANPDLGSIVPEEMIIEEMSSRCLNLGTILLIDKSGMLTNVEHRLDSADNYFAQAADLMTGLKSKKIGEDIYNVAFSRSGVCLARCGIHPCEADLYQAQAIVHMLRAASVEYMPEVSYTKEITSHGKAIKMLLSLWVQSPQQEILENLVAQFVEWTKSQVRSFLRQLQEYAPPIGDEQSTDFWAFISDEAQQVLLAPDADKLDLGFFRKDEEGSWTVAVDVADLE